MNKSTNTGCNEEWAYLSDVWVLYIGIVGDNI